MLAIQRTRLRLEAFDRLMAKRGLTHDAERARAIGVQPSTLWRIRRGDMRPGERFISLTLAFLEVPFEELFEIEVERPKDAA